MLDQDQTGRAPEVSRPAGEGETRVGIYVCRCGGNISDVVNCERVTQAVGRLPNVAVARTDQSLCSDAGQAMIEHDIAELGLNRIVIGACAPSLHEQTFRGTVARAGLNPYLYQHVGLREQDSWVHHADPAGATDKAIRLMRAGLAKAHHLTALEPIRLPAGQHALVIGAGIAGLRAAWDIARRGLRVTLIEKSPFLGGHMAQLEAVFPNAEPARETLHDLIEKVLAHPLITVHTLAELAAVRGYVGDFQVQVRRQSRGVRAGGGDLNAAIAACPMEVPDEHNLGLATRKAIYRAYPGCYPDIPAIDWEHCTRCGACQEADGQRIDLDSRAETLDLSVGAIVIATGFRRYEPPTGEYGYGQLPEVITLAQLIRWLALHPGERQLVWNGRAVRSLALIHCVGSRQIEGLHAPQPNGQVNSYCSRVCCTAALQAANELRERFPEITVFDLHQDIRTYGRGHEDLYTRASANQVRFLRFAGEAPPEVRPAPAGEAYPVLVEIKDCLTGGEALEVPVDLVVLATGMLPSPVEDLIRLLKVSPGNDGFLLEVHPKLRPVETAVPGIVLAGTAQAPMNIQESCAAAGAAAAKVAVLLGRGSVELEPFVARVDPERCTGSGECVAICPYEDAIALRPVGVNGRQAQRAVVTPANCVGCGMCVSACPNRAIDVQGWTLDQYEAMVTAIAAAHETEAEVSA